jgi:hypothetical protein
MTNQQRLARPTGIRLKSWARMVNVRLVQRPPDLSAGACAGPGRQARSARPGWSEMIQGVWSGFSCHRLHHAAGIDAVSERIDRPVTGDVLDLLARHADVRQLPVTQVVQGGS